MSAAGIIFSNLNTNTLSELTADRTVAAIPFACRYRLVDFCISNMVNAGITNVNIVSNYNYRSLAEHIGSGKDWDLARRKGGINFISPFQTSHSPSAKLYSFHMESLKNMKEYINEIEDELVVLADTDHVLNIDLSAVIDFHETSGASVTFVTTPIASDFEAKRPRIMVSAEGGKITNITTAMKYTEAAPELCVNIFVMKTAYLRKIIQHAEEQNQSSLTELFIRNFKHAGYRAYSYNGYVASISSFLDYYRSSIEMATNEIARDSLLKSAPVYTRVHNSSPTVYRSESTVENSLIADDCIIEGTVINSVLSRNVHVAKGAVVKNSVLFTGTYVGKNAKLNCVVSDKDVHITDGVELSGNANLPIYIEKLRHV